MSRGGLKGAKAEKTPHISETVAKIWCAKTTVMENICTTTKMFFSARIRLGYGCSYASSIVWCVIVVR